MEEIKVFVVGAATYYASWIKNHKLVDNLEEADVVLFTGGEDVDPSMYGKKKHPRTFCNLARDLEEKEVFDKIKDNQLALGICRGSQFLCVMNGGLLVQDCTNHAIGETHAISNREISVEITSTHHQMQYPFNLNKGKDYDILYWASPKRSHWYEGDGIDIPSCEPEVVHYHVEGKPKCLAIQGHPEMMREESPVIELLNDLLTQCLTDVR